jgi:hypothetical protein
VSKRSRKFLDLGYGEQTPITRLECGTSPDSAASTLMR